MIISGDGTEERIRLAERLRAVRLHAGLSGKELSQKSGWQPSKVSRLETGRQLPSEPDLLRWMELCGVDEGDREGLLALREAATTAHRTWQQRMRRGQQPVQADYNRLVEASTRIRHFETAWVPGLLQTPVYARIVFTEMVSLHHVDIRDIDSAVNTRMQRQRCLYDTTKHFEFLLAEPVLRWRFCPPEVLRAQLDRLRGVIGMPNVRFGILPLDATVGTPPQNAFQLYDSTAVVETFAGETMHSRVDSAIYNRVLDRLWSDALVGDTALTALEAAGALLTG
ncbi:MAG: hypothetical protein QG622_2944 [Actinomycetota bacterium]|nr:hypothetical protein [Actinomycetota bacterium]